MSEETANRDALTGALDRSSLKDQLERLVGHANQTGTPLALILIDLDHFKSVNDAFGHARGDQVLLEFVRRLSSMTRTSDLIFRYGGDEFVLLMPDTLKAQAQLMAERILDKIGSQPFGGEPPLSLSLSIGLAGYPEGRTAESLFERADERLIEAKRRGRGAVVGEDPSALNEMRLVESSRLVERETQLETAHRFFEAMTEKKRGVLKILGVESAGRTRFLTEMSKAAHLRGYEVLSLDATAALRQRVFGALSESSYQWDGQVLTSTNAAAYAQALPDMLEDQGRFGLMIAVDNLPQLDFTALSYIRDLLSSSAVQHIAVVYTTDPASPQPEVSLDTPLHKEVEVSALSTDGSRIWLREVLQWEPDEAFLKWFHEQTGGLPALLRGGLDILLDERALTRSETGWTPRSDFSAIALGSRLGALRAPRATNLPSLRSFVGREDELKLAKSLISENRHLTIVGPGGIGKSHFALQLALESLHDFRDGAFYVPLAALNSPEYLVLTIAGALNFGFLGGDDPKAEFLNYLRSKKMLLLLDNFEHLLSGADLISEMLASAPRLKILVTSRVGLETESETALELRGMGFPEGEADPTAESFHAVQLFMERARRAHSDFSIAEEEMPHLVRICQLVEGMPLGIELAAAWAPVLSCASIAEGIETNLDFLKTSRPDIPERHRSLRAVFDHFWGSLSETERDVLRALSVFRGGFRQDSAEEVAGASFFFLSALVERSLLRKEHRGRYEMHEVLRQYAEEELLQERVKTESARRRHADHFACFMERHEQGLKAGRQLQALEEIGVEAENLRAAWSWATEAGESESLRRSMDSVFLFYDMRNRFQEGEDVFRAAAEAVRNLARTADGEASSLHWLLGRLLARQARFLFRLSFYEEAGQALQESLKLLGEREVGNDRAMILNILGDVARVLGDYEAAHQHHRQALDLYRKTGDRPGLANALNHLGITAATVGDFRIAKDRFQESLGTWREIGDRWNTANVLNNLGNISSLLGEHIEARDLFEDSRDACMEIGDRRGIANAINNLGLVEEELGDLEQASQLYQEGVVRYQEIGDQGGIALALVNLGKVNHKLGESQVARLLLHEAMRTGLAVRALPVVIEALVENAAIQLVEGEVNEAHHLLSLAVAHPATDQESRDRAQSLLADLDGDLMVQPARIESPAEEDLERVVKAVLSRAPTLHQEAARYPSAELLRETLPA